MNADQLCDKWIAKLQQEFLVAEGTDSETWEAEVEAAMLDLSEQVSDMLSDIEQRLNQGGYAIALRRGPQPFRH